MMHSNSRLFFSHLFIAVHYTLIVLYEWLQSFLRGAGISTKDDFMEWPDTPVGVHEDGLALKWTGNGMLFSWKPIPVVTANRTKEKSR